MVLDAATAPAVRTLASVISAYSITVDGRGIQMERGLNLVIFRGWRQTVEDGVPFEADIYKLEGGSCWTIEVVTGDGLSNV